MSDIVGRYIPKHSNAMFGLHDRAQAEDLRNRVVAPDPEPFDTSVLDEPVADPTKCAITFNAPKGFKIRCGNMLTIADRWGICTDCRRKGFTIG
jgi:hypothetical protein